VSLGLVLALARWAKWLRARGGAPAWVAAVPWVTGVAWLLGAGTGLVEALRAARAMDVADPGAKARVLAEGISEAMNASAFSVGLMLAAALALLVVTLRRRA
jgi:hypothetical protein